MVHCSDVNPCKFNAATFEQAGFRDNDICLPFVKMIKCYAAKNKYVILFTGPIKNSQNHLTLQPLFNRISWFVEPGNEIISSGEMPLLKANS